MGCAETKLSFVDLLYEKNYRFQSKKFTGFFSEIYQTVNSQDSQFYIIKLYNIKNISSKLSIPPEILLTHLNQKMKSIQILGGVSSLTPIVECTVSEESVILVFNYYEETVQNIIEKSQLTSQQLVSYINELLNTLQQIHNLYQIHGNLSTSKLYIRKLDGSIIIGDIGLPYNLLLNSEYQKLITNKNHLFIPPEIISNKYLQNYGTQWDVWALGVIIINMIMPKFFNIFLEELMGDNGIMNINNIKITLSSNTNNQVIDNIINQDSSDILSTDDQGQIIRFLKDNNISNEQIDEYRLFSSIITKCLQNDPNDRSTVNELISERIFDEINVIKLLDSKIGSNIYTTRKKSSQYITEDRLVEDTINSVLDDRITKESGINFIVSRKYHFFTDPKNKQYQPRIFDMLVNKINDNLEVVDLSNVVIGTKSQLYIQCIFDLIKFQNQITTLDLGRCQIGPLGVFFLGPTLDYLTNLETLWLECNRISQQNIHMLTKYISNLVHLKQLSIFNEYKSPDKLDDGGLRSLIFSLKFLTCLQSLDIKNNSFGDKGLCDMKYLSNLKQLYIGGNESVGDSGIKSLCESIKYISSLEILWIDRTNIGMKSIPVLSGTIPYLPNLSQLDLHHNYDIILHQIPDSLSQLIPRHNYHGFRWHIYEE